MDLSHKKLRLEIQAMHTAVIRARVQTCRKLIAEIKNISQKKTVDKLKHEKNVRKVQRLTNEVHFLRHMKPNLVAKFCLSHTDESIEKLRKQPDVTPQLRALAKVSSHKLIKPLVDEFRKKFPKWHETLPKLLEKESDVIGIVSSNEKVAVDRKHQASNESLRESEKDSDDEEISDDDRLKERTQNITSNDTSHEIIKSNEYSNRTNAEKKINSKKGAAQFSLKFSPHKLKSTFKKRKLSSSETCESDKRKSLPGSNVKNWFVETVKDSGIKIDNIKRAESEGEKESLQKQTKIAGDSFLNSSTGAIDKSFNNNEEKSNMFVQESIQNKNEISPNNRKSKRSISNREEDKNHNTNEITKKSNIQSTDIKDVEPEDKAESRPKKTKNEDSFFNRSAEKFDKSFNSNEEKSNIFAKESVQIKDVISPNNRKSKRSISNREDDKKHNTNEIRNKSKIQNTDIKSEEREDKAESRPKKTKIEDSFFNRSSEEVDKSFNSNEEKSNIFAKESIQIKDVISTNNRKSKRSISNREVDRNNSTNEIKKIDNEEETEINVKNEYNQNKKQKTEIKLETVQQQEDPFFITKDNNKYLTFGKIEEPKVETAPQLSVNRQFQQQSSKVWNDKKYFTNTMKGSNLNKFQNRNYQAKDRNFNNSEDMKEHLHPSWAAKKRTSSLVPFQGKKISFDD